MSATCNRVSVTFLCLWGFLSFVIASDGQALPILVGHRYSGAAYTLINAKGSLGSEGQIARESAALIHGENPWPRTKNLLRN